MFSFKKKRDFVVSHHEIKWNLSSMFLTTLKIYILVRKWYLLENRTKLQNYKIKIKMSTVLSSSIAKLIILSLLTLVSLLREKSMINIISNTYMFESQVVVTLSNTYRLKSVYWAWSTPDIYLEVGDSCCCIHSNL